MIQIAIDASKAKMRALAFSGGAPANRIRAESAW
jgi:hypothetical protein